MNPVRQIRKLDAMPEVRTIFGVVIEKGVKSPTPYGALQKIGRALDVGDSFLWHEKIDVQNRLGKYIPGRRFMTKKQPDGQYRIWRIE